MSDVLFEILKAVLVLAVILITRYAVPWIKLRLEDSRYSWLVRWAEIAVLSAEQTVFGDKTGPEKKAIVTKFLKNLLIEKNISISDKQLENLIEAAVFELNGGKKNEDQRKRIESDQAI